MKEIYDVLDCIKAGVADIGARLDDPETGLAEIKHEIRDIERRLDMQDKKDNKKDSKKEDKKDEEILWVLKGKKKQFSVLCVGNVTVTTEQLYVFVGQIVPDDGCCDHDGHKEITGYLTLTLTAPLLAVAGNAQAILEQPYYLVGDTVKINIDNINTIGPANPPFVAVALTAAADE